MTHKGNFEAFVSVELLLERQYHEHSVDIATESANAVSSPGPDLRADVINKLESVTMQSLRQSHVKVGPVNQHHYCRSPQSSSVYQRSISSIKLSESAGYFGYAD